MNSIIISTLMLSALVVAPSLATSQSTSQKSRMVIQNEATPGTFADLQKLINGDTTGKITLDNDYVADTDSNEPDTCLTIAENKTITIDLNGHIIDRNLFSEADDGNCFEVYGNLTIEDNSDSHSGKICGGYVISSSWDIYASAINIYPNASLVLNSGTVTANGSSIICLCYSADIDKKGAIFTMNGGTIIGNQNDPTATKRSGIATSSIDYYDGLPYYSELAPKIFINGGNISDCGTGVVASDCDITFNGGEISNNINIDRRFGGGAWIGNNSRFTMNGGVIKNNNAIGGGGGVDIAGGIFIMNGGEISGNASVHGGGISVFTEAGFKSYCILRGGEIKDNLTCDYPAPDNNGPWEDWAGCLGGGVLLCRNGDVSYGYLYFEIGGDIKIYDNKNILGYDDDVSFVNCQFFDSSLGMEETVHFSTGEFAPKDEMKFAINGVCYENDFGILFPLGSLSNHFPISSECDQDYSSHVTYQGSDDFGIIYNQETKRLECVKTDNIATIKTDEIKDVTYPDKPKFTGNVFDKDGTKIGPAKIEYKPAGGYDSEYTTDVPTKTGKYTVRASYGGTDYYTSSIIKDFCYRMSSSVDITIPRSSNLDDFSPKIEIKLGDGTVYHGEVIKEYKLTSDPDSSYVEQMPTKDGNYNLRVTIPETDCFAGCSKVTEFKISEGHIGPVKNCYYHYALIGILVAEIALFAVGIFKRNKISIILMAMCGVSSVIVGLVGSSFTSCIICFILSIVSVLVLAGCLIFSFIKIEKLETHR